MDFSDLPNTDDSVFDEDTFGDYGEPRRAQHLHL